MMNGMSKRKQDILAICIFIIAFFVVYFLITRNEFLYGSSVDWESQHYLIPEYFRTLFYSTKDFFPDFAPHLGSGQNIYYFSYYGFLSPIILISYLLPFMEMVDYIQLIGILIPISSTILFYFYLRRHTSYKISLLVSFLFLCAGPVMFHSHRHLMFVNYLPFFMLALFGLDSFLEKGHISLLSFSCFFIIMISYYYSVGSLIALFCYGIYKLIEKKDFNLKKMVHFMCPFILAILSSMVLLMPTLYTLLNGRDATNKVISFISLLTPKRSFRFILYDTYAIGLTCISLISIIYLFVKRKKENIFLGLILLCISIFPICNYILNGTLYIDAKSLIPFLPIILLVTASFIEDLFAGKISFKQIFVVLFGIILLTNSKLVYVDVLFLLFLFGFYFKAKKDFFFIVPLMVFAYAIGIASNLEDTLEKKKTINSKEYLQIEDAVTYITEREENIYRINNGIAASITMNKIVNDEHYATTLYSSTFNKNYNDFFFEVANNAIPYRNKSMTPSSNHPIFQILAGEKYLITTKKSIEDAELIYDKNGVRIFEKNHVLPIGYATSNIISKESYDTLIYPNNMLALLGAVVAEDGKDYQAIESSMIDYEVLEKKNIDFEVKEHVFVEAKEGATLKVKLNGDYQNKLFFVRFKNNYNPPCGVEELAITINGVKNKLSCTTWKYHNQNLIFDYVFYNTNTLQIKFVQGSYDLSDFEIYAVDYSKFYEMIDSVDEFIFDKETTLGDTINGEINVTENGYFVMSIPYDKGFRAYVDGHEVSVQKVNDIFIGFEIEKGKHTIEITYEAPYKKICLWISGIGVIGMFLVLWYEKRNYKWKN